MGHLNSNTLVLFQFVEKHGEPLYNTIKDKYKERKVFFVYGGVDTDTREQIREIVENETNAIIVQVHSAFSTGINIRNIDNIVFWNFQKQNQSASVPWSWFAWRQKQKSQSL